MGAILPPGHYQDKYAVDGALYVDEVPQFVADNLSDGAKLYVLHGRNTDSGLMTLTTATFEGMEDACAVDRTVLHNHMAECRVIKSAAEVTLLRHVSQVCRSDVSGCC